MSLYFFISHAVSESRWLPYTSATLEIVGLLQIDAHPVSRMYNRTAG